MKRNTNGPPKGRRLQKAKPALVIMTVLLITVMASVASYAVTGRTDANAGAGSMNYYQQEIAGAGVNALGSVGADGQARYSYQIGAVSLNYSSNSDWSVGGYSVIARSTKKGVPQYTTNDLFELDGEELVHIGSGSDSYGACEEYRTKHETFQKICYYSSNGIWRIYKPDGSLAEYTKKIKAVGGNSDLNQGKPRAWAVAMVRNRGNDEFVYYEYLDYEGECYLRKVVSGKLGWTWTGNRYTTTILTWGGHGFQRKYSYRTGSKVLLNGYILNKVEKYMGTDTYGSCDQNGRANPGELVEGCRIIYLDNQLIGNSIRTRKPLIQQILGYGTDPGNCRPPVTFTYSGLNLEMAPEAEKKVYTMDTYELRAASVRDTYDNIHSYVADFMDINGDGLPDRISQWRNQNTMSIWRNNGDGFTPMPNQTVDANPLRVTHGPELGLYRTVYDYFDINGDGLPDRVSKELRGELKVRLNTGSGFAAETTWWSGGTNTDYLGSCLRNGDQYNLYADYLDMNGDGLVDLVFIDPLRNNNPVFKVYLNTGTGMAANYTSWGTLDLSKYADEWDEVLNYRLRHIDFTFGESHPDAYGSNIGGQLMDVNGDGLPDYVIKRASGHEQIDPRSKFIVCYNNGQGFEAPVEWNVTDNRCLVDMDVVRHDYFNGDGYDYIDINNDGLPDRVMKTVVEDILHTHYSYLKVWFNNGNGFDPEQIYTVDTTDQYLLRGDMVCSPSGVENDRQFTGVFADYIDINGDGFPDRVVKAPPRVLVEGDTFLVAIMGLPNTSGDLYVYLNKAADYGLPDVLETIENGQGGKTTYGYQPLNKVNNPGCKPSMWVVAEVKVKDGMGNCEKTTYEYKDGVYDPIEKEFRGFGTVITTEPTGNFTVTGYYTDPDKKGLISYNNYFKPVSSGSHLISTTAYQYNAPVLTAPGNSQVKFISLAKKTQTTVDNLTVGQSVVSEYQYDAYGNITKTVETEDWHNDKRITQNWYNISTIGSNGHWNNWNLRQLVISSVVGYDKDRNFRLQGATCNTYDSAGNLSTTRNWLDNATPYPTASDGSISAPNVNDTRWVNQVSYFYDINGNVNQVKDARGNSTYTTYDTKYGMFPVKTVNALGHTTWNYYDYYGSDYDVDVISNQITLGRPTRTAFQDTGLYSSQYYDIFGRVVKKVRMDYSQSAPSEETVYTDALLQSYGEHDIMTPASVAVIKRPLLGQAGPDNQLIKSYTYLDGRGRTIQTSTSVGGGFSTAPTRYEINGDKTKTITYMPFLTTSPVFLTSFQSRFTVTTSWFDETEGWKSVVTGSEGSVSTTVRQIWSTTVTDPMNNVTNSQNNGFGQTYAVIDPGLCMTSYAYETGSGNLVGVTDYYCNRTTYIYNTLGQRVKETDPDLGTTTYAYDSNGNLISKTDANGQTFTYEYDVLNRLIKTTYPGTGNRDESIYDNDNDPQFDEGYATGQLVQTNVYRNGALQEQQRFEYDRYGNIIYQYHRIDDKTSGIGYQYDLLGRVISATYPGQDVFSYKYQATGVDSITKQSNNLQILAGTRYTATGKIEHMQLNGLHPFFINYSYWDYYQVGADMLREITASAGSFTTEYSYDRNGNVLSIVDGTGHSQSFTYDNRNRMIQANGNNLYGLKNYYYDAIGNMTGMEGKTYAYEMALGKSSKPHAVKTVYNDGTYVYQYDAVGNMIEKSATGGLTENLITIPAAILNYDVYGLNKVTLSDRAQLKSATGAYGPVGSRDQIEVSMDAKAGTITAGGNIFLRDRSSVYGDVQQSSGKTLAIQNNVFIGGTTYSIAGMTLPDITVNNIDFTGVAQTTTNVNSGQSSNIAPGKYWNYNVSGELKLTPGVYYFNSLQMYMNSKLTLDEANGPVKIYVQNTLMMQAGIFHSRAGKDGTRSLLIGYLGTQDVNLDGSAAFGGTVIAPRAKLIMGNGANKVFEGMFIGKEVTFAANSQITCVPFIELTPEIWHYKYDWNNKLVEVQHNYQTVMTSKYGVGGDRIKKSENGTNTYYYFAEYEEDWSPNGSLINNSKYIFANGKRIANENAAGQFSYYVGDHLGSNTVVLNDTLNVVKTMKYLPYGATAYESGTRAEDYRFNGKELDATGLYYYGARFYDPNLGRFITADTATPGDGFDSQGLNRYSYCLNNPVKYIDPSGHEPYGFSSTSEFNTYDDAADSYYCGLDTSFWLGNETLGKIQAHYGMSDFWGDTEGSMTDFGGQYSNTFKFPISKSNSISLSMSTGFERNITLALYDGESLNSSASTASAKLEAGITHKLAANGLLNQLTFKVIGNFKSEIKEGKLKLSYGPGINLSAKGSLPNKISVAASSGIGLNWSVKSPQPLLLKTELGIISVNIGLPNGLSMKGGYKHFIQEKIVKGSPVNFNYGQMSLGASLKLGNVTYSLGGQSTIYGAEPKAFEKPWGIYSGLEW